MERELLQAEHRRQRQAGPGAGGPGGPGNIGADLLHAAQHVAAVGAAINDLISTDNKLGDAVKQDSGQ